MDLLSLSYGEEAKLIAETFLGGNFVLTLSNGKTHKMSVAETSPQVLDGPWRINFGRDTATLAAPFSLETGKLRSWDQLPDSRAKGFTGTADYETTFTIDPELLKKGRRVYLDLGSVKVMAGITVNGKTLETLWMPPFRADITGLLRKGKNSLVVKVTSTNPCSSPGMAGPVRLIVTSGKKYKTD